MSEFTKLVIDKEGYVSPKSLASLFHTTIKGIAVVSGLSVDVVSKKLRSQSTPAQTRLNDMIQIINQVTPWCGDVFQAYAWYCSEQLPSFGGLTAKDLVNRGKADAVKRYLARTSDGGYA